MQEFTKQFIIKLIYMDIVNHKLTSSLTDIQINVEPYYLGIDDLVFEMIGLTDLPNEDAIFEEYLMRSSKVKQMNLKTEKQKVQLLAEDLFKFLLNSKPE